MGSGLMKKVRHCGMGSATSFSVMDQLRGRPMFTGIQAVLPLPQGLTPGPPQ